MCVSIERCVKLLQSQAGTRSRKFLGDALRCKQCMLQTSVRRGRQSRSNAPVRRALKIVRGYAPAAAQFAVEQRHLQLRPLSVVAGADLGTSAPKCRDSALESPHRQLLLFFADCHRMVKHILAIFPMVSMSLSINLRMHSTIYALCTAARVCGLNMQSCTRESNSCGASMSRAT